MVLIVQVESLTDSHGLLPNAEMGGSTVVVPNALKASLRLDRQKHFLKLPHKDHVFKDAHERLGPVSLNL
jgi:hypothetical protein